MGNLFTEAMGSILTTLLGNVLTELVGKVLDIYRCILICLKELGSISPTRSGLRISHIFVFCVVLLILWW